jgi:hypothetical protein
MVQVRDNLAQQIDLLAAVIGPLRGQASDSAARMREAVDEARTDRIGSDREYDRSCRHRPLCREDPDGARRDDDVRLQFRKFGCDLVCPLAASVEVPARILMNSLRCMCLSKDYGPCDREPTTLQWGCSRAVAATN